MQPTPAGASRPGAGRRPENLALAFQEVLTVGERLRSNRQPVTDANSFRMQLREALNRAVTEARQRGYTDEDADLAKFAVTAFLDESILNLRNPIFADWPRRPLQEEFYGHHIAGEVFFQHLQKLLGRQDSPDLADVIEVYQLCLLLGFAGRYSVSGRAELQQITAAASDKIRRIRGASGRLSPHGGLPEETVSRAVKGDPLVRWLAIGSAALLLIAVLVWAGAKMSLGGQVGQLKQMARQGQR